MIRTIIGGSGKVHKLTLRSTIEIRDIDAISTEEEIEAALIETLEVNSCEDMSINLQKGTLRRNRMVFVELEA